MLKKLKNLHSLAVISLVETSQVEIFQEAISQVEIFSKAYKTLITD
jgi:hypothetical protein